MTCKFTGTVPTVERQLHKLKPRGNEVKCVASLLCGLSDLAGTGAVVTAIYVVDRITGTTSDTLVVLSGGSEDLWET